MGTVGSRDQVTHTIPPLYNSNSRILVLGTMPSPKSREVGFYYMHPQNRFWSVLARLLNEELPQGRDGRAAMALKHGIALWDVLHSCEITGASDAAIRNPCANDLKPILECTKIRAIFTTGTKAHQLYQRHIFPHIGREAIALPSTSPANCAWSLDKLCNAYGRIIKILEDES